MEGQKWYIAKFPLREGMPIYTSPPFNSLFIHLFTCYILSPSEVHQIDIWAQLTSWPSIQEVGVYLKWFHKRKICFTKEGCLVPPPGPNNCCLLCSGFASSIGRTGPFFSLRWLSPPQVGFPAQPGYLCILCSPSLLYFSPQYLTPLTSKYSSVLLILSPYVKTEASYEHRWVFC